MRRLTVACRLVMMQLPDLWVVVARQDRVVAAQ